jgi:hypothetical protein
LKVENGPKLLVAARRDAAPQSYKAAVHAPRSISIVGRSGVRDKDEAARAAIGACFWCFELTLAV